VGWLWLRQSQRPGPVTLVGAVLAALGLVLVLDLLAGTDVSLHGVAWALGAMVGAASYFVISADEGNGLPPLVLAAGGLSVGTVALVLLAVAGLLPMHVATAAPEYADRSVVWWMPLLVLGLVTAALAYTTGIGAGRRLGSRLASFVALLEVLAGVVFAWMLLDQLPRPVQLLGSLLILAGVVAVKLGERSVVRAEPAPGEAGTSVGSPSAAASTHGGSDRSACA
jgi:drug/metabolite transporter (DMT)-like permease